jgi:hypothetical protein
MIPLLAAASAVSQIGTTAISQSSATEGKKGTGAASESFGALLAAHGVGGPLGSGAAGLGGAAAGQGGG